MIEIILNIYLVLNNGLVEAFKVVSYEMEGGDDRKIEFLKSHAKEDFPKAIVFDVPTDKNEKFMEFVMSVYHLFTDKYLSYASPKVTSLGRATMLNAWSFDKGVRSALKNYLKYIAANPFRIFKKAHMQSILIIQPVDLLPNGDQNMCDGCPDMTYWKDKNGTEQLVWSCRLEEPMQYGDFLRMVPKDKHELQIK